MNTEYFEQRIKDLNAALEQCMTQYHIVAGRLEEAKFFLEKETESQKNSEENSQDSTHKVDDKETKQEDISQ